MDTLFLVLFNPIKAFDKVKMTNKFSISNFLIVLFLMLINLILMIPVIERVTYITFSAMTLTDNQMDTVLQIAHKMRYLHVAGSEVLYFFMFLFYGFLLYLFVYFTKDKSENEIKYKAALQLFINSYFIVVIGDLINTILIYIRGLDAISNTYDTSLLGLNIFTSVEQVGATIYTFLSHFTPFHFAFIIILGIGIKVFTEAKYMKSMSISLTLWLITILVPTLSVYYSELVIEN